MAIIGGRIRQVLRILHTEGLCSRGDIRRHMDVEGDDITTYLARAMQHGLVRKHAETWPARYGITTAGIELVKCGSRQTECINPGWMANVWDS